MKNKKIVYVVESLAGGVLSYLISMSNHYVKDYEITILYGIRNQTPYNFKEFFDEKVSFIKVDNFTRSINFLSDYKSYKEIEKWINCISPDIVHLNSSKAGAIGRIIKFIHFKKNKNIKFLYTPHGYAFMMKNQSILKRKTYYMIEKVLGSLNTITVSCGLGEYYYSKKINSNSTYVNNSVDITKIEMLNYMNENNRSRYERVVYTVGRISYQKNPKLFNEIALKNPNYKFVWIGDGPDSKLLTANNIYVSGWIPQKELFRFTSSFKFFILCSRWEGLPMSLLEAMASKKICFVTNVSGNKEVISDSCGIKFDSAEDFTRKFNSIKNNDIKRLSNEAFNEVKQNYSIEDFFEKYDKIYESI